MKDLQPQVKEYMESMGWVWQEPYEDGSAISSWRYNLSDVLQKQAELLYLNTRKIELEAILGVAQGIMIHQYPTKFPDGKDIGLKYISHNDRVVVGFNELKNISDGWKDELVEVNKLLEEYK